MQSGRGFREYAPFCWFPVHLAKRSASSLVLQVIVILFPGFLSTFISQAAFIAVASSEFILFIISSGTCIGFVSVSIVISPRMKVSFLLFSWWFRDVV